MMSPRKVSAAGTVLLLLAGLFTAGCSEQSSAPMTTTGSETLHLNGPTGGYTAAAEAPAFSDPELAASAVTETPLPELYAGYPEDPRITRWERRESTVVYAVTLLWGQIKSDPSLGSGAEAEDTGSEGYDWSGYAEFTRGGILLRSTIGFENDDTIQRPHVNRTRIDWVSHTTTGYDGLRLAVYQPLPGLDEDVLHIVAGSNEWAIPIGDLADLEETYDVDDAGNQFMIRAFRIDPELCSRGFTGGSWSVPDDEGIGHLRGRWVNVRGEMAGYVRGHYGINASGDRILFGKVIDLDGNHVGILRGTWDVRRENLGGSAGHFQAEIIGDDEGVIGLSRGRWRTLRGSSGGGFFEGGWSIGCRP